MPLSSPRRMAPLVAALALAAIVPAAALADTFTVTSLADAGAGSLRQAILDANAVPGEDTIDFAPGVEGTIELASPLPAVSEALLILGPGFDVLTVDANQHGRVLLFRGTASDVFELAELSLTGGLVQDSTDGGCIKLDLGQELILDSMHLFGCRVEGPSADYGGGVAAVLNGALTIRRSLITDNEAALGGGIAGTAITLVSSTVARNRASLRGGGIRSSGALHLFDSTVTLNVADTGSGGSISSGGGLHLRSTAELILYRSTITDNRADNGPGVNLTSGATVIDVAGNVIAGNRFLGTGNERNCFPDLGIADQSNLSGDASCGFTGASDFENVDPQLFPLAANGGPTPTQVPAPDSPLVDAGDNLFCGNFDQRGVARPIDGDGDFVATCDIGATEYRPITDDPIHVDGFESGDVSAWSAVAP